MDGEGQGGEKGDANSDPGPPRRSPAFGRDLLGRTARTGARTNRPAARSAPGPPPGPVGEPAGGPDRQTVCPGKPIGTVGWAGGWSRARRGPTYSSAAAVLWPLIPFETDPFETLPHFPVVPADASCHGPTRMVRSGSRQAV